MMWQWRQEGPIGSLLLSVNTCLLVMVQNGLSLSVFGSLLGRPPLRYVTVRLPLAGTLNNKLIFGGDKNVDAVQNIKSVGTTLSARRFWRRSKPSLFEYPNALPNVRVTESRAVAC